MIVSEVYQPGELAEIPALPSTGSIVMTVVSITHVVVHLLVLPLPEHLAQLVPVAGVVPVQVLLVQVEGEHLDSGDKKCCKIS